MRSRIRIVYFAPLVLCACGPSNLGKVNYYASAGGKTQPAAPAGVCPGYKPNVKRAYFGDLHVHTSYSFDAYFFNSLSSPKTAYAFAKGAPAQMPCGDKFDAPCRTMKLDAPLDFTAVTDHAEFLGLTMACSMEGRSAKRPLACKLFGEYLRKNVAKMVSGGAPAPQAGIDALEKITDPTDSWTRAIAAAEEANEPCKFTSFIAFEHSAQPNGAMLHRNVIFNGTTIRAVPISGFEAKDEWQLFNRLDALCPHGRNGLDCDYITIPHNSNLSEGLMFQATPLVGATPASQAHVEQKAQSDRLVEITQHKGDSECARGFSGPLSAEEDEACSFEKAKPLCTGAPTDSFNCRKECTKVATTVGGGESAPSDCTTRLDMVRDGLAQGLKLADSYKGINPYKLGFVGATDTHNGTPGNVREDTWQGHGGILDEEPRELLGAWECPDGKSKCAPLTRVFNPSAFLFNPGGVTGVWAEENARNALFAAMKRREAFATSGPRIAIKMYANFQALPADLCASLEAGNDPIEAQEVSAVVMGGDLPRAPQGKRPQFAVRAVADAILGTPLQRIEIIKGWMDGAGVLHTKVFRVGGDAKGPAPDAACKVTKTGEPEQLCGLFTDADFQPSQRAFYYARALENPSCRWSTWMCVKNNIDCSQIDRNTGVLVGAAAGYEGCCNITHDKTSYAATQKFDTIEERAWGSPIWYDP